METLNQPAELRTRCDSWRAEGYTVGLVPTMGGLHHGHLSLVKKAMQLADKCVVTIFINPTQFGPHEDLDQYPRDLEDDLQQCRAAGVDLVFVPSAVQMYPDGFETVVNMTRLTERLCAPHRPGHFSGVCTVVAKLFNMVGPCRACFGEKDYQQLRIIRRMAIDLNLPVEISGCPIVREQDGLALSSRNAYLTQEERHSATSLYQGLCQLRDLGRAG